MNFDPRTATEAELAKFLSISEAQAATMKPANLRAIAEDMLRIAERGRGGAEERLLASNAKTFFEPCRRCFGRGAYGETKSGTRFEYDPRHFSAAEGDRYVTCAECRGFGRKTCTEARAKYLARRRVRAERKEYAAIRAAVRAEHGYSDADFDRLVGKKISGEKTPKAWIEAARAFAAFFGVEVRRAA